MTVHVDIGINGAFLTRRWEEPENWMRLTRELGYPYHSFCADALDPFFSGDREYQLEAAERTRAAAKKYGATIWDVYTGVATHRFHGLQGPDLDYLQWIRRFGAFTEILHLQQTTADASHHWPFTEEYNERGHVRVPAVLDALRWSHEHARENPLSDVLPPCDACIL